MDFSQHFIKQAFSRDCNKHYTNITHKLNTQQDHVKYYDSSYSTISDNTENLISKLIKPQYKLHVDLMDTGSMDCGLFAVAITFGIDPSTQIFRQEDMRPDMVECLSKQQITPFPIKKKRRVTELITKTIIIYACPVCEEIENGDTMVNVVIGFCSKE